MSSSLSTRAIVPSPLFTFWMISLMPAEASLAMATIWSAC